MVSGRVGHDAAHEIHVNAVPAIINAATINAAMFMLEIYTEIEQEHWRQDQASDDFFFTQLSPSS